MFYILSIDAATLEETSGYLKYIPDNYNPGFFDIRKFTGKMLLLSNTMDEHAVAIFEGGQITESFGGAGTTECVTSVIVVGHPCTNGDEHMPGQSCNNGEVNDAYYSVSVFTDCTTTWDYSSPPTNFTGGGGGGNGTSWTQGFFNSLDDNQRKFINDRPNLKTAILNHLQYGGGWSIAEDAVSACMDGKINLELTLLLLNNVDNWSRKMYDYMKDNSFSPASVAFIYQFADFTKKGYKKEVGEDIFDACITGKITTAFAFDLLEFAGDDKVSKTEKLIQYLAQSNYSLKSIDNTEQIMSLILNNNMNIIMTDRILTSLLQNPIPQYTLGNYPGMAESMPFKWWEDMQYIQNNLIIKSDNPIVLIEGPNPLELFLFSRFPQQAILHVQNSISALDRAQELATQNVYTHPHNGKADAFRHAFWNALDAAEIGVFMTKLFTDAHEWNSGNHPLETAMDDHNNIAGQAVGDDYNFLTPDHVIEDAVDATMGAGVLKYLTPLGSSGQISSNTQIKFTNQ